MESAYASMLKAAGQAAQAAGVADGAQDPLRAEFEGFLRWEAATRDTMDVKRIYIDLAGDLAAGVMLSEIVYWHLRDRQGGSRLSVQHEGRFWIATRRYEWWERCRLSPDQADGALRRLVLKGLVEKRVFKFRGEPTVHVRLVLEAFLPMLRDAITAPCPNPYRPAPAGERETETAPGQEPIGAEASSISGIAPDPLTETTGRESPPPPPAARAALAAPAYPGTQSEAARHPDLVLAREIMGGLYPGPADWRLYVDRIQLIRQASPGLDEPALAAAGRPYHAAWVARGHSPTHPAWTEWWLNGRIPEPGERRRHGKKTSRRPAPSEAELQEARRSASELSRLVAGAPGEETGHAGP